MAEKANPPKVDSIFCGSLFQLWVVLYKLSGRFKADSARVFFNLER